MVGKTNVNPPDGGTQSPSRGVTRNVGEITGDVVSLVDLQMELFKVDSRETLQRLMVPVVLVAAGATVALGTIPVALLFVAAAIVAFTGLSQWLALLIAAIFGFATAAILAVVGRDRLRQPLDLFHRSRQELKRNIQWMKRVVARDGDSPRRTSAPPPLTGSRG